MTDYIKIAQKISSPRNQKILKSNLKQIINEKYNKRGWRKEVAETLNMNINTFNGIINQSNISKISLEKLMYLVNKLDLDMSKVLSGNKIIKSSQGRYGDNGESKKWTTDTKYQFVSDYKNNNIEYVAKKYNITTRTAETYYIQFKKKVKIL